MKLCASILGGKWYQNHVLWMYTIYFFLIKKSLRTIELSKEK